MPDHSWTQPESAANTDYQPVYPYNNIQQTEAGHKFEMDEVRGGAVGGGGLPTPHYAKGGDDVGVGLALLPFLPSLQHVRVGCQAERSYPAPLAPHLPGQGMKIVVF